MIIQFVDNISHRTYYQDTSQLRDPGAERGGGDIEHKFTESL